MINEMKKYLSVSIDMIVILLISGVTLYFDINMFTKFVGSLFILFFFPGYLLFEILFPEQKDLQAVVKLSSSVGVSIAFSGLFLFLIVYLFEYSLDSILIGYFLCFIIMIFSISYRRFINFDLASSQVKSRTWYSYDITSKIMIVVTAVGLTAMFVAFSFLLEQRAINSPQFTEFYILGPNKELTDYVFDVVGKTPISIFVGITNHEREKMIYSIAAFVDGDIVEVKDRIIVMDGATWEGELILILDEMGQNKRVDIYLLRGDIKGIYRELTLWLNVLPFENK